ncbi:MAG TPA: hypothetical protein GXZ49_01280 [Bacteroidetes bacterium]|nr:hypothetical protein [Bacteroidota bacterium]
MGTIRGKKYFVGWFFTVLFALFFWSITLNVHVHIVDGITVVHSHPYPYGNRDVETNHSHSNNSYQLLHFIAGLIYLIVPVVYGLNIIINFANKGYIPESFEIGQNLFNKERFPRGPPYLI